MDNSVVHKPVVAGFAKVRTVLLKEMPLEAFAEKLPERIGLAEAVGYLAGDGVSLRSNGAYAHFEFSGHSTQERAASLGLAQLVYEAIERARKDVVFDQIAANTGANVTIRLGVLQDAIRSPRVCVERKEQLEALSALIDAKRRAGNPLYQDA